MAAKAGGEARENPLMLNTLLRRMYDGMRELRAMEPRRGAVREGERSLLGEEACRASSLLSLEEGDLVSEVAGSRLTKKVRGGTRKSPMETMAPGVVLLRGTGDTTERLMLAVGAASALRAQGAGRLVLAYVGAEEVSPARWKQVLRTAGEAELPIVFFVLPGEPGGRQGMVSDRAQSWGVPGMPVDAADAVALYRVMQESAMRARNGDGPALLEGVAWRPAGAGAGVDGLEAMRRLLRGRGLLK